MQTRLLLPVLFVLAACVALTAQPTDDLYQARLTADSLFKKGKYPEAYLMVEDALKKTIEKDSNYADLRGIKAACHIYLKQYDEALAIYPEIMPLIAKYWGPNSLLYGKNLYLNGTALNSMWNSVAAEEKFLEAMPILESGAGGISANKDGATAVKASGAAACVKKSLLLTELCFGG